MQNSHRVAVIALSLFLAAGCSRKAESAPAPNVLATAAPAAPGAVAESKGTVQASPAASRALVVTAEIRVTTNDVAAAVRHIRADVERDGGYVSDATVSGGTATIEVRVPSDKTKGIRAALADLGTISSDVEKVEDVTEARADLKARLQNARAQETRVLEIMKTKTGSLHDVLQAENELARVRENIERLEAQERSMDGRIALATVKIHLCASATASAPAPEPWETPGKSIGRSFSAGLRGAAALAVYSAMALAMASPILIPLVAVVAIAIGLIRRQRRRSALLTPAG